MGARPEFPVITAIGRPEERGWMYGRQARDRITTAISAYARVFRHYADWDWAQVQRHAERFAPVIADFSPTSAREIKAIAAGAGVEEADILALNTRSEIMFATAASRMPSECTSFALTEGDAVVAGQNWDWLVQARETAVVLKVHRDDGPDLVTVVEAGMLAKTGLNESGVGLCTNTLISDKEEGRLGVPYHVLLRAALDSDDGPSAAKRIDEADRANSANYLIVDDTGYCSDLETTPGTGPAGRIGLADGVLTHSNHFLTAGLTGRDLYTERKPHTVNRRDNLDDSLRGMNTPTLTGIATALGDHRDAPSSVCQHPDDRLPLEERTCTVAGVVLDTRNAVVHVAAGNPCEAVWRQVSLREGEG
ncbi:MAG: C45 family peptidase [Kibdelosporangium sp.]